jgi:G3E family GTPase
MSGESRRPVTLLGGFLGSGKTTLLRRLLQSAWAEGVAVIVNEFGQAGLDYELVRTLVEDSAVVSGGCACCSRRNELADAIKRLVDQDQRREIGPIKRIVIETTGLADPAPIISTLMSDPVLQHQVLIDSVLVTVDAVSGWDQLDRYDEARKQASVADVLLITKTDQVEERKVRDLSGRLSAVNPQAKIATAIFGEVTDPAALAARANLTMVAPSDRGSGHSASTGSFTLSLDASLNWIAFSAWISMLIHAHGEQVLRMKGLIHAGSLGGVLVNSVQHVLYPPEHIDNWPSLSRSSQLVFITRELQHDPVLRSLNAFQRIGDLAS